MLSAPNLVVVSSAASQLAVDPQLQTRNKEAIRNACLNDGERKAEREEISSRNKQAQVASLVAETSCYCTHSTSLLGLPCFMVFHL